MFVCRDLVEREENFNCDVSDAFLIRFLRAKKYDYEAAFKMLQRYLGIRARREGGSLKTCTISNINRLLFPGSGSFELLGQNPYSEYGSDIPRVKFALYFLKKVT
jgi:hypothetical protein